MPNDNDYLYYNNVNHYYVDYYYVDHRANDDYNYNSSSSDDLCLGAELP